MGIAVRRSDKIYVTVKQKDVLFVAILWIAILLGFHLTMGSGRWQIFALNGKVINA